MPSRKAAIKELRKRDKRTERNKGVISSIKTYAKNVESLIAAGKKKELAAAFNEFMSKIQKAAAKGIIPKGRASRKISRIASKLQKVKAA